MFFSGLKTLCIILQNEEREMSKVNNLAPSPLPNWLELKQRLFLLLEKKLLLFSLIDRSDQRKPRLIPNEMPQDKWLVGKGRDCKQYQIF